MPPTVAYRAAFQALPDSIPARIRDAASRSIDTALAEEAEVGDQSAADLMRSLADPDDDDGDRRDFIAAYFLNGYAIPDADIESAIRAAALTYTP